MFVQKIFRILIGGSLLCCGFRYTFAVHEAKRMSDVRILSSNERKLVFEYLPEFPSFETVDINNQTYTSLQVHNCGIIYEEGKPILPSRTLLVGAPNHGYVTTIISDFQYIARPRRTEC